MIPKKPEQWLTHISLAQKYRAAFNREQRWKDNFDWYMGKYPKGVIPVNIVFGITRGTIPKVYFKSPTIVCRPRPGNPRSYAERMSQAKTLEAADALIVQQIGLKRTLKACTLDALLYNVAIIKVGYHSVDTELPDQSEQVDEMMDVLEELMGPAASVEDEDDRKRKLYSYHDLVKPDMPWALRVSPMDFVVPVGTRCIEEAPWCAFKVQRRLDEVKASPVYRNTRNLRPNAKLTILGESSGVESPSLYRQIGVSEDDDYVVMWEIWDKRTGLIQVVVDGHDEFLRKEEHGLPLETLPVEVIQINPSGDDFWGISQVDAIAPQVIEYNETRTMEMLHRRISGLRVIALRSAFSPEEQAKLERGDIGPIVLCNDAVQNVNNAVVTFTPNMSRDIFKVADDIFNDIRTIIGYNRNQGGEFESSRRTAAEVKTVSQNNFIRDDEVRDIVADAIANLFQTKIHPIIFANWKTKRIVELTSMPGDGIPWVEYDPARIRGDYDVYVVPDSTIPMTKEMEKAESLAVFQLLRNDPNIRQPQLYRQFLDKYPQFKLDELLKTPQELQQEQMQQLQIEMMLNQSRTQPTEGGNGKAQRPAPKAQPKPQQPQRPR